MLVVGLVVLIFIAFGVLCALLSVPSIVWAGVAILRHGTRLAGLGVLAAGAVGVVAAWCFVQAIHRQWLPLDNVVFCWLHFLVPAEQPYRFFFAWTPIGFVVPATAVAMLTGGRAFWKQIKQSERGREPAVRR